MIFLKPMFNTEDLIFIILIYFCIYHLYHFKTAYKLYSTWYNRDSYSCNKFNLTVTLNIKMNIFYSYNFYVCVYIGSA